MTIRLNRHRCMTALFSLALGLSAAVLPISRLEAQQEADRQGSMPICNSAKNQSMTTGLTYNPRVIQLDRSQPGASTTTTPPAFTPIASNMSTPLASRGGGRSMPALLAMQGRIEARYGVPLPVLLAIWGAETDYGAAKGGFDLAGSLATLAYEGRRRELFAAEFIALLKMVDRGVPREKLKGSWAGPSATRNSCPRSICAWHRTVTAMALPISGPAGLIRYLPSAPISVTRVGSRAYQAWPPRWRTDLTATV
jgi:membrane-bound lytic murein transglycosylase B